MAREEWHIEYKVGRGQGVVDFYVSGYDDAAIRAKDGFQFLMAVREGDRMPCPRCGYTLRVPLFSTAEVKCEYCVMCGRDGRYSACFFPLDGDSLIQHLRMLDPMRTYRKNLHLQADANNERLIAERERKAMNEIESVTKDHYNDLVGIPTFRYSGSKQFKGTPDA